MTFEEKNLVWKFRFYLTRDKKALTKFLHSVTWSDEAEVKQAQDLIENWVEIDVEDVLELLSSQFEAKFVRQFAISRISKASDDDLLLYLLQLVQAIRYEKIGDRGPIDSPLVNFLIEKSVGNFTWAVNLHWFPFSLISGI